MASLLLLVLVFSKSMENSTTSDSRDVLAVWWLKPKISRSIGRFFFAIFGASPFVFEELVKRFLLASIVSK